MPVIKCPDCGKIISVRFPIHDCIIPIEFPPPKPKEPEQTTLPKLLTADHQGFIYE